MNVVAAQANKCEEKLLKKKTKKNQRDSVAFYDFTDRPLWYFSGCMFFHHDVTNSFLCLYRNSAVYQSRKHWGLEWTTESEQHRMLDSPPTEGEMCGWARLSLPRQPRRTVNFFFSLLSLPTSWNSAPPAGLFLWSSGGNCSISHARWVHDSQMCKWSNTHVSQVLRTDSGRAHVAIESNYMKTFFFSSLKSPYLAQLTCLMLNVICFFVFCFQHF